MTLSVCQYTRFSEPSSQDSSEQTVLVFKTNLKTKEDVGAISPVLNSPANIAEWSVDHNDCDDILRVAGSGLTNDMIINLIESAGFRCEVLPSNPVGLRTITRKPKRPKVDLFDIIGYACPGRLE